MQGEEEFLGGFFGHHLKRGSFPGYGIYATNKRIIGVGRSGNWRGAPAGSLLGSAPEVVLVSSGKVSLRSERKLTKDDGAKIVAWLDGNKKDFELYKEQVSQIELKRLGLVHSGFLRITSSFGEDVKVWIANPIDFEITKNLMQAFFPEAVRFVDS